MKTKSTTRSLLITLLALTMGVLQIGCQKAEKGDIGPAGAAGPKGDTGAQGPAGSANVTQVSFNTAFAPTTSKVLNLPASIDKATIEKSLVVVYMQQSGNTTLWYQIPGLVIGDDFRYYVATSSTVQTLTIIRASGTAITSVTGVRVLLIPATNLVNGRQAAVDFSNYEEVKRFYNLTD